MNKKEHPPSKLTAASTTSPSRHVTITKLLMLPLFAAAFFAASLSTPVENAAQSVSSDLAAEAGLTTPAASASADGCTWNSGGHNCLYLNGTGRYVNYVRTTKYKYGIQVCGSGHWVYAIHPDGSWHTLSWRSTSTCSWLRQHFTSYVRRSLPSGTKVCARLFHNYGQRDGGDPCVWVR